MDIPIDRARFEQLRAEHGVYSAIAIAKAEARAAAIAELRSSIFRLTPLGTDFDVDLRQVLDRIADLLED